MSVQVFRPWASRFGKKTILHRLADYGSFWGSSVAEAARATRPDVILVLTTPPLIASGAALVAAARSIPLVCWVQDVYPDLAVHLGALSANRPVIAPLARLARMTYRASRAVVAISDGMADKLCERGAERSRLRVIPNWADGALVAPVPTTSNAFRRSEGLEGRFVAMYSGNMGAGHDVATLVDAARLLEKTCPNLVLTFVGDGARRAEAERAARGLDNVRFFAYRERGALGESLSAADVHLVTLREGLDGLIVPSKCSWCHRVWSPSFLSRTCSLRGSARHRGGSVGVAGRPGDARGLADALASAASMPGWAALHAERIRECFRGPVRPKDRHSAIERYPARKRDIEIGRLFAGQKAKLRRFA